MAVAHFKEETFDTDVIGSETPSLVDFTATWCGPCKQLAPIVEDLAGVYDGSVKVGKLDVDESPGVAAKFGIRSVPTLLFFKGGEVVDKITGMQSRDEIESRLKSAFGL